MYSNALNSGVGLEFYADRETSAYTSCDMH